MTWYAWTMIALFALNALASIAMIGKPRQPGTPEGAMLVVVFNAVLIWGIVEIAG